MKLFVAPDLIDLSYLADFKEPLLDLTREDQRIILVNHFLRAYSLRLNDVKFDLQRLSDNWIHFSKFYGSVWLDVSFGLDQVSAHIRHPQDEEMVRDIYGKLTEPLKQAEIGSQRMTMQVHFSTKEDVNLYLRDLNPTSPSKFRDLLGGRGVFYTLNIPNHNLTIYITVINSLYVPAGLFLSIENVFSPNKYDFSTTLDVSKEQYDFIFAELDINLEKGA